MEENVQAKFKQQAILRDELEEEEKYMNPRANNIIINTSENMACCQVASWIDKACIVLFPTLFLSFNVGYWIHYSP